jgi:hypothetical protein
MTREDAALMLDKYVNGELAAEVDAKWARESSAQRRRMREEIVAALAFDVEPRGQS